MTIKDALARYHKIEIDLLLSRVLGKTKEFLYINPDYRLKTADQRKLLQIIKRRQKGEPIAYILGYKNFFGLMFKVNKNVLIPRPETELLVELALERIKNPLSFLPLSKGEMKRGWNVIDVGTGSGCIITTIAKKQSVYSSLDYCTPHFYAIDSSAKALKIARANARRQGVKNKIKFLQGNLLNSLSALPLTRRRINGGISNLILANLPYLTPAQVKSNPDLAYEPRQALDAGKDGLRYYRELFKQIHALCHSDLPARLWRDPESNTLLINTGLDSRLRENDNIIILLLEHDPSQKQKLAHLAKKYFPLPAKISGRNLDGQAKIKFHKDLSGRFRICEIYFPMP